jgi:hypothetical protein
LGGFLLPPLVNFLFVKFSLFGTFLIFGAVFLHYALAGFLCRPIEDNFKLHLKSQTKSCYSEEEEKNRSEADGNEKFEAVQEAEQDGQG